MKITVNIRDLVEDSASNYNGTLQVSAAIDLDDLFSSLPEKEDIDIDILDLLAEHRQIAAIWSIEDVQSVRPDLSEEQAWEVLQTVDRHKDANLGITWLTLEMAAEHLFGDAPETDKAEEA